MNGMKNIAERRIRPLGLQAKPVFFPDTEKLSNFTPQNRKEQRSQRWWTGYSNGIRKQIPDLFSNPEKATDK